MTIGQFNKTHKDEEHSVSMGSAMSVPIREQTYQRAVKKPQFYSNTLSGLKNNFIDVKEEISKIV